MKVCKSLLWRHVKFLDAVISYSSIFNLAYSPLSRISHSKQCLKYCIRVASLFCLCPLYTPPVVNTNSTELFFNCFSSCHMDFPKVLSLILSQLQNTFFFPLWLLAPPKKKKKFSFWSCKFISVDSGTVRMKLKFSVEGFSHKMLI